MEAKKTGMEPYESQTWLSFLTCVFQLRQMETMSTLSFRLCQTLTLPSSPTGLPASLSLMPNNVQSLSLMMRSGDLCQITMGSPGRCTGSLGQVEDLKVTGLPFPRVNIEAGSFQATLTGNFCQTRSKAWGSDKGDNYTNQ